MPCPDLDSYGFNGAKHHCRSARVDHLRSDLSLANSPSLSGILTVSPNCASSASKTDLIAFSTASAPVLTTKWRGAPDGAMRFSSALKRSDKMVWYSECAYREETNGRDSATACNSSGSFSPNALV